MKKLFAILLAVSLMATMSVTAFAEESTTNITLVLTDSYGDGWETATIKACLVKSDGSEELLREGMAVPFDSYSEENIEDTYEFTVDKFAVVRFYWVGSEEYDDECGVTIKRDGNIQYEQNGYEITDGALIFESENNPRYTTVTYSVAPAYTVTIPTDVTIDGNSTTISAEDVVVEKGQYVSVILAENNDFTVKTAEGAELAYTVTANGEDVAPGDELLAVNPADSAAGTATITFDIDESDIKYAGTYTGTATFTIAVKDAPKTIINFTMDSSDFEEWIPGLTTNLQAEAGMTWAEWIESDYNVDDYVMIEYWDGSYVICPEGEEWVAVRDTKIDEFDGIVLPTDEIVADNTYTLIQILG